MKIFLRMAWVAWVAAGANVAFAVIEETWVYAVQVTAAVQATPARIELNWQIDSHPVSGYTVYRKKPGESTWGNGVDLLPSATSYVDEAVAIGTVYEYQIVKHAKHPYGDAYKGYGYISTGINAPLVDQRGKLILVIDASIAVPLGAELERLQRDLTGDGWIVVRKEVSRDGRPADVRAAIKAEYEADRERVKAVFLLGHVPVVKSGNLNVDGHRARPMPGDVFYGEMDGEWRDANSDGIYDPSVLPSDVELQVGRVDFARFTGDVVKYQFPTEIELLKRYLDKDHAFRHAAVRPSPRALVGNLNGDANGQAYAASGYRNFAVLLGPTNIQTVNTDLDTPVADRFISMLAKTDYLWAYGAGSGDDFSVNSLGTNGEFNGLWSPDFIEQKSKATFYQFFGSWFADWSQPDNFLRAALTAPDYGLAASWSGRPHHYFHHMGMGETIGYGIRVSQNNNGTTYQNQVQRQLRGIHIALMGDPTLRMNMIAPPTELASGEAGSVVELSWKGSSDAVLGYHVYRSANGGAFIRITEELVTETRFIDASRPADSTSYMVRAVALHLGPSGSYYNASQGAFIRVAAAPNVAARTDP